MRREEFEEQILAYLEGSLDPLAKAAFESAAQDQPELGELLSGYREMMSIEKDIAKEEYRASPSFALRVMDAAAEIRPSFAEQVAEFFRTFKPMIVGAATMALVMVVVLRRPGGESNKTVSYSKQREIEHSVPLSNSTNQKVGTTTSADKHPAPQEPREAHFDWSAPFEIQSFDSSVDHHAFSMELPDVPASIEALTNSREEIFPTGLGVPLAISYEAVMTGRSADEFLLRVSLTALPQGLSGAPVVKDLTVTYEFNHSFLRSAKPLGAKVDKPIELPGKPMLWSSGARMAGHQQFTTLLLLHFKTGDNGRNPPLMRGSVSYTIASEQRQKQQEFTLTRDNILPSPERASPELKRYWSLIVPGTKFKFTEPATPSQAAGNEFKSMSDKLQSLGK